MPKGKKDDITDVGAIERATSPADDTITLSSGVVLRGKVIPPLILIQVMASIPRPDPPMVFMKQMGREMENPNDPDYQERLQAWKVDYSDRLTNAMIALGTELVRAPKKLDGPDQDGWLEEYRLLGMPMHQGNKNWRYLTWVKYRGILNQDDMAKIQEIVGRLSGVRESAVQSAESFSGSDQAN